MASIARVTQCHLHRRNFNIADGCPECKAAARLAVGNRVVSCHIHNYIHPENETCPKCQDIAAGAATRYKVPSDHQKDMLQAIDELEDKFKVLVNEGKTMDNSRRISQALTNVEQGMMWLRKAVMKADKED